MNLSARKLLRAGRARYLLLGTVLGLLLAPVGVHAATGVLTTITKQSVGTASGALPENETTWLLTAAANYLLDTSASGGTQQVPMQPNLTLTAIASGTYTSTQTQADQTTNYNYRGIACTLTSTAVVSAGSFTLEIDGKDSVTGTYYPLLTGTAVSTVTSQTLTVYPGITAAANASASTILPRTWRVKATYNSGTSLTYAVGCSLEL
jgi:hypothetical protein